MNGAGPVKYGIISYYTNMLLCRITCMVLLKSVIQMRGGNVSGCSVAEQFGKPTTNTIPSIVRGFKSTVTKQINIVRSTPGSPVWQRGYHEHIIRNEKAYTKISEYIIYNPEKWMEDKYYVD